MRETGLGRLCAAFGTDRLLRAKLLSTVFRDAGLARHDPLKAYVWGFLDVPLAWQFHADHGWVDCDAATQEALRQAERRGEQSVELRVRSWAYSYDLAGLTQTNLSTRRSRELRRHNPWETPAGSPASAGGSAGAPADPALPRWQFSTGFGWADCDEETQRLLREAEARGERQLEVGMRHFTYLLDLDAKSQTNLASGRTRQLRRLPPASPAGPAAVATASGVAGG